MKILKYTIGLIILLVASGCQRNKVQAERSIEGKWKVSEVVIQYGSFSNNTFIEERSERETGDLGSFDFTQDQVAYSFKLGAVQLNATTDWLLSYERVNSGFTRVPKYTLNVGDEFTFDVFFEDGTKNSEQGAENMVFTSIPNNGDSELIVLSLNKE